ncbi:MAG TPA: tetratricopeptide repeat protein [Herpetosiphonaceae bacterium]|nr:tetratricopeptide repeat protein [Herpetosiphonaceae bacterium]
MSHQFGDLLSQYLHRKHGLSQARLAAGIGQPPFVISLMCRGERLTGRGARARVLAIVSWLHEQGVLTALDEAQALLTAAGLSSFDPVLPDDGHLLQTLQHANPAQNAAAHTRSDVPAALSSFVGREQELATATHLLRANHLLTLTGVGGVGKTRLALEVAAAVRSEFADGICFVSLAPIGDPALVASAIAHALNLREVAGVPLVETLKAALRSRQTLLAIDNFEHLLPAAPLVAELPGAAPRLRALVTSRAPLHVSGEQEFAVPPLALPDPEQPLTMDVARVEAVALFVQRVQAFRPDFQLTMENARAITDICLRLDGLPLAIELAAARSKVLPPSALLARLTGRVPGRLNVLAGPPGAFPARQRTLRATIAWSYDLLRPREQLLLRRLAVFVGGCTLKAVDIVCDVDGDLHGDTLEQLATLVDNSLLQQGGSRDGEARFSMLETIQEYALEQLVASGELEAMRRRHADFFVAMMEAAQSALSGPAQAMWVARLEMEHTNLRAALQWSCAQTGRDTGLWLVGVMGEFWARRGYLSEGRAWIDLALRQNEAERVSGPVEASLPLRATALQWAGLFAMWQGDLVDAETRYKESLALFRELGNREGMADELCHLGMLFQLRGDYERARALLEESLALFRDFGEARGLAWSLYFMGTLAYSQADYGRARALWEESLARLRNRGDTWGIAAVLTHLGIVALIQGDFERAGGRLAESMKLLRQLGDRWQAAFTLEICAGLAAAQEGARRGALQAARIFGAAEALRETLGAPLLPFQQEPYQQGVATTRAQLDDKTFAEAWAEGRTMSLEQVVNYTLEILSSGGAATTNSEPSALMTPPVPDATPSYPSVGETMPQSDLAPAPELLTSREVEVLHLVARGLTNKQVADTFVISPRTVEKHLASIYRKLEVSSRTAAVRCATDRDLI